MLQNLVELKGQLVERRSELMKDLHIEAREFEKIASPMKADLADFATDMRERETSHYIAEMKWREIRQIEKALNKMGEGVYDRCESCGSKIPIARLRVLPSATLCVTCQEDADQTEIRSNPVPVWGALMDVIPTSTDQQ